jgi:Spy/CpxP family protein refolding chaperone
MNEHNNKEEGVFMNRVMISTFAIIFFLAAVSLAQPMKHDMDKMPPGCAQNKTCCGMGPQHMGMKGMPEIPDLTDEQKGQLDKLQVEHMKAVQPLRNKLMEKRAELHSLTTAEDVNMGKINALIEEIGKIRIEMMKEQQKHHQAVRKMLNEKQRLLFDNRPMHGRNMMED